MTHETLYYQLVNTMHQDALRTIISEQLESIGYQPVSIDVLTDETFPYIDCRVDIEEVFCAQMIGFFVDITALVPDYTEPYYYLPIVVTCDNYSEHINGLINREISLAHELKHIRDIIALIKQQPDYPDRLYRYGMNNMADIDDLTKSIDLELFKLFYMEPPAMTMDFEKGETAILIPLDSGANQVIRYVCDSADEYVGMNLYNYFLKIKQGYRTKFDDEKAKQRIDREMDAALTRHGKTVFGPEPLQGLDALKKKSAPKLFSAIAAGKFA